MAFGVILSLSYYCVVAVLLLVVAVFSLFTLYIHYVHRKYSHIPSPKRPSFYLGHALDIINAQRRNTNVEIPLSEHIYRWYLACSKSEVYVVFLIWKEMVITVNPDDIKNLIMEPRNGKPELFLQNLKYLYGERFLGNGLFSIPDIESWKRRRRLYDPAFKKGYLKSLVPSFNECVDKFLARLRPLADGRTQVPMSDHFANLALEVIGKAGFGSDFSQGWPDDLGLKRLKGARKLSFLVDNTRKGFEKVFMFPLPQLLKYLHPYEVEGYRETTRAIRSIGRDCIKKRIKAMEHGEPPCNDILAHIIEVIKTGEHTDLEDLVDDFATFYVAGQETTANLLSFSLALVELHPHVLERLLSEIDEVLGDKEHVGVEDLEQLQYTEQVLLEALRLYPPVPAISKCAKNGGVTLSGYHIPEGTHISLPTGILCHMPEYFDDPENFDPSRFNPDREKPSSFVFFPFGIGHRSCIGNHFSLIETKIVLARFLQTFKATLPGDYKLVATGNLVLKPTGTLPCALECRK